VIVGLVLVLLLLVARFSRPYGVAGGVVLIGVSLAWLVVDKDLEGPTLVRVTGDHGLVSADLVGLVGAALGVVQVVAALRRR
jgi:hypothetical protein